uniref:E3 ubiquitin-protein ligase RNF31-like n=1 Tax=Haplochromis burtoni TaxID=8153 RepID=A0A3Q2WD32_HAPBU
MASLSEQLQDVRSQAEVCLYSGGRVVDLRAGVVAMANLPLPPCSKYHHIAAETMRLSTALNILEKYGCNLTNPNRPKYWRTVKHNNPVFRATVDAIQGGRAVLCLYGYSNQQPDGLSFPDDVTDPDVGRVAAVTLEVMSLRMELEMLIKVCVNFLYASFYFSSSSTWRCLHCTKVNSIQDVLCDECEQPRLEPLGSKEEECQPSCTMVNAASSILCEVCERPRLATRPPVTPSHPPITPPRPPAPVLGMPGDPDSWQVWFTVVSDSLPVTLLQWVCQFCTYLNYSPAMVCEMCDLARPEPAPLPVKLHLDSWRQNLIKEEGLKLIQLIRHGEKKGVSPEEVYTSMRVAGDSNILPCKWLKTELPLLLDQIRMLVATSVIQLSRAEAKQAWLTAGGDTERAARQALRDRLAKVKELCALGFSDESHCHEVLRQSGGEVRGALALLQRPLLEPFHKRIWSEKPEPPVDIHHPDKQRVCRWLLAVYDLPSWGRCELALSLLLEHSAPYSLEDVVQAVQESHDREFIKRVLAKECPICLSVFPHSKMQSLTSCQCSVCCGCFQQHFTIAVRDKHIRDMVCPVCWEPDINDPEHLNSYFSTLDIQLRECLEPEVYELFHKKLTEQALIKDPKFLWCCHCSYGFIYDGDQLKVTCFQCRNSFCAHCKKPWESQHAGLSCEQFQSWKRENDPEYQRQGLAGYLRDNGITCPNCRFQYALSKGGCMHFCCSQCRYQFCSGCNNPFHTTCAVDQCTVSGLHAHHPRDCLFYLRDWEPSRLQALLQVNTHTCNCGMTHKDGKRRGKQEGGQQSDAACGAQTQPGHAGLCEKHYREYLVSLINSHSIDPAPLYSSNELLLACRRYKVEDTHRDGEDTFTYYTRLLEKLMDEVPLGDKVPRKK